MVLVTMMVLVAAMDWCGMNMMDVAGWPGVQHWFRMSIDRQLVGRLERQWFGIRCAVERWCVVMAKVSQQLDYNCTHRFHHFRKGIDCSPKNLEKNERNERYYYFNSFERVTDNNWLQTYGTQCQCKYKSKANGCVYFHIGIFLLYFFLEIIEMSVVDVLISLRYWMNNWCLHSRNRIFL